MAPQPAHILTSLALNRMSDFALETASSAREPFKYGKITLFHANCLEWLGRREQYSVHAVITDPPYGLFEYSEEQQSKLRKGK